MTVGGDPDELRRLAAGGPGQAFTLDHTARVLEHAARRHAVRNQHSRVAPVPAVQRLHRLARRIARVDRWVLLVAAALRAADVATLRSRLLLFGAGHPATTAVVGPRAVPVALPVDRLTDRELDEIAGWPRLPGPWRDRVHRERIRRWLARTDQRIAVVPPELSGGLLDRIAQWVDERLLDRISPLVDLHLSHAETVARVTARAAGARWLLAQPGLTVWSFSPSTPTRAPTVRVALGDPGTASHLALLLPGTGAGLHAPVASLAQAAALHHRVAQRGGVSTSVATVLDLYAAPSDLGRAADPESGRTAGAATAEFLADLPNPAERTTIVGHSYGAFAAAQALATPVEALVLLGAPGTGVAHRSELADAGEVWVAQARDEPIRAVADLDEFLAGLPPRLQPTAGPLADPLVALGPDPADPEFGARGLPTDPRGPADSRSANRGHTDYLAPGTVALDATAGVVLGTPPR